MEHYKNLSLDNIIYKNDEEVECIEIWKDVVGYEGFYKVSNLGRVKSSKRRINTFKSSRVKNELILKNKIHPTFYIYINLNKNNSNKTFKVHRLVAIAFIHNSEDKPEINHKNGIKTDNFIKNLEWSSPKENCRHRSDNNLYKSIKGENHFSCKLTEKEVLEIRVIGNSKTQRELAKKYNVHHSRISSILNRKTWKHI